MRIQLMAWMFVCCYCVFCVGSDLCFGLITLPEESYQLCVCVCVIYKSQQIADIDTVRLLQHNEKESTLSFSMFAVTRYRRLDMRGNLQNIRRGLTQFGLQNHEVYHSFSGTSFLLQYIVPSPVPHSFSSVSFLLRYIIPSPVHHSFSSTSLLLQYITPSPVYEPFPLFCSPCTRFSERQR